MLRPDAKLLVVPIAENWMAWAAQVPSGLLVGVGETWEQVDSARARAEAAGWTHCLFVEGSSTEIPWQTGFFTHAVIRAEPTAEILRVLIPGGEILH